LAFSGVGAGPRRRRVLPALSTCSVPSYCYTRRFSLVPSYKRIKILPCYRRSYRCPLLHPIRSCTWQTISPSQSSEPAVPHTLGREGHGRFRSTNFCPRHACTHQVHTICSFHYHSWQAQARQAAQPARQDLGKIARKTAS
jgi:hypothetical protein